MAAISNTPGATGSGNIPSAGEMKDYSDKVNNMDLKSLGAELGKNLELWQRDAVEKALFNKTQPAETQGAGGGGGGAEGEDEKKKLLKKLLDGTISPEEMQKLAGMMPPGTKIEDLEGLKGKGAAAGGGGGGGGDNYDIQGG